MTQHTASRRCLSIRLWIIARRVRRSPFAQHVRQAAEGAKISAGMLAAVGVLYLLCGMASAFRP